METTTIVVKKSTWQFLNGKKQCGESMDDVINRICGKEKIVVKGVPLYG